MKRLVGYSRFIVFIAVVQMIVALGLYELFIGRLDLPDWLIIESLDDLKKKVVDVLVVFVAVKGVEELFSGHSSADVLRTVGAVAILIAALTFFKWNAPSKSLRRPTGDPDAMDSIE